MAAIGTFPSDANPAHVKLKISQVITVGNLPMYNVPQMDCQPFSPTCRCYT